MPSDDVMSRCVQVRKYLLRLDIRKSHVKFWRPEVRTLRRCNHLVRLRRIKACQHNLRGSLWSGASWTTVWYFGGWHPLICFCFFCWQILLLVANPRSSYHLIEFTNDLKKVQNKDWMEAHSYVAEWPRRGGLLDIVSCLIIDDFHGAWLHFRRARVSWGGCLVQLCSKYRIVSATSNPYH